MSTIWPVALPQAPLVSGFGEKPPETTIRTQMDTGAAKVRQRTTAGARPMDTVFLMTTAQVATFETFFNTTLSGGSLSFEWTHPRTGTTGTFRIKSTPDYKPVGATHWHVSMQMEQLP